MKYSSLQGTLEKLHFPDPQIFRTAGLINLSKMYTAYPATLEGARIAILLPNGLIPKDASRLSEGAAAAKRVIVLKEEAKKWTRVWPNSTTVVEQPVPAAQPAQKVNSGDEEFEIVEE